MKKLFALIFAAVLFAGCSNSVDNNDFIKNGLLNKLGISKNYSLKIRLNAENSRTITPFESDEILAECVNNIDEWTLNFTGLNYDDENTYEDFSMTAQVVDGMILVETENKGLYNLEVIGSHQIEEVTYNFYGFAEEIELSSDVDEIPELNIPVGIVKKDAFGSFGAEITFSNDFWPYAFEKKINALSQDEKLFEVTLVNKDDEDQKIELVPEYNFGSGLDGSVLTSIILTCEEIPSAYYELSIKYNLSLVNDSESDVENVVLDKGNLVVIGDSVKTQAALVACYNKPVSRIVDTYYACSNEDAAGNGLYPQTKGYSWAIIKNIFENAKAITNVTVYCEDFVIDAVEYAELKDITNANGKDVSVTVFYKNGSCVIKNDSGSYSISVERSLVVSAGKFGPVDSTDFPKLEIDQFKVGEAQTVNIIYKDFVTVVLKNTDFFGNYGKKHFYFDNIKDFEKKIPFFVYYRAPDDDSPDYFLDGSYSYKSAQIYVIRNDEYQYTESYGILMADSTDDAELTIGFTKLYDGQPDFSNYRQFYVAEKPAISFVEPEQKYFVGNCSNPGSSLVEYTPGLSDVSFAVYTDKNCTVQYDGLSDFSWYLNGKWLNVDNEPIFSITSSDISTAAAVESVLRFNSDNVIECVIDDGTGKTYCASFKFNLVLPKDMVSTPYFSRNTIKMFNYDSSITYKVLDIYNDVNVGKTKIFQDGTMFLSYKKDAQNDEGKYYAQSVSGKLLEIDADVALLNFMNKDNVISVAKDISTGYIWLCYTGEDLKSVNLAVIQNPSSGDMLSVKLASEATSMYKPCIAACNGKIYIYHNFTTVTVYEPDISDSKLNISELTTAYLDIPLVDNDNMPLFDQSEDEYEFAVVPYEGGVRAAVVHSQSSHEKTLNVNKEGDSLDVYSFSCITSFVMDSEGNVSDLHSNVGYNRNNTDYYNFVYSNPKYNYLTKFNLCYVANVETDWDGTVDGKLVLCGKTKILAIKEDEVILSDSGIYGYKDDDDKIKVKNKSRLVKYNFDGLLEKIDEVDDAKINFKITATSGYHQWTNNNVITE